jgi:putative Mg2+ transporter-C (MgtC) family protein
VEESGVHHFVVSRGLESVAPLDFTVRVAIALVLGAMIGAERQWRQRNAGLRTNALVAVGTSLFVMITPLIGGSSNVFQIVSYVVSGIGFLAGGVIFKERSSVSGLNTAATLWCTAAVGALVGFGFLPEAMIGVLAIILANVALRPIARIINAHTIEDTEILASYEVYAVCRPDVEDAIRTVLTDTLHDARLPMTALYTEMVGEQRMEVVADITVPGRAEVKLERVVSRLAKEPGIIGTSFRLVPTSADEQAALAESGATE